MTLRFDPAATLALGRDVLNHEAQALLTAEEALGNTDDFIRAVELILNIRGRLVVSGVGKSGHIGRKLAATFASTGTPAFRSQKFFNLMSGRPKTPTTSCSAFRIRAKQTNS